MDRFAALFRRIGLLGVIVVLLALAASCAVRTVSTGQVGVVTLFGAITSEQLSEGIHLLNPLKRVAELSVRTQEAKEHAEVPSSEGLIIALEASLLHRLDPGRAAEVYQKIGPRYTDVLVSPNFRSVMRAVTAAHTANALYSDAREQIEAKQQAEQDAQRMQFVLQKERQEAERKGTKPRASRTFSASSHRGSGAAAGVEGNRSHPRRLLPCALCLVIRAFCLLLCRQAAALMAFSSAVTLSVASQVSSLSLLPK